MLVHCINNLTQVTHDENALGVHYNGVLLIHVRRTLDNTVIKLDNTVIKLENTVMKLDNTVYIRQYSVY